MMCLPLFRRLGGPLVAAFALTPALLCFGAGSALSDGPVISPLSGLLQNISGAVVWGSTGWRDLPPDEHGFATRSAYRAGFGVNYRPGFGADTLVTTEAQDSVGVRLKSFDPISGETHALKAKRTIKITQSSTQTPGPVILSFGYMTQDGIWLESEEYRAKAIARGFYVGAFWTLAQRKGIKFPTVGAAAEFLDLTETAVTVRGIPLRMSSKGTVAPEIYVGGSFPAAKYVRGFLQLSYQYVRFPSVTYDLTTGAAPLPAGVLESLPRDIRFGAFHLGAGITFSGGGVFSKGK